MNPIDTLNIVLDQQAAMRREARNRTLARAARTRHRSRSTAHDDLGAATSNVDAARSRPNWTQ